MVNTGKKTVKRITVERFRTVRAKEGVAWRGMGRRVRGGKKARGWREMVVDQNRDAARASKSLTIAAKAKSIEVRPRV